VGVERITVDIDREWLSVNDICDYMGVSTLGREWRVARVDFEDWLNAERFRSGHRDPGS